MIDAPATAMMTVQDTGGAPSLAEAAKQLGVSPEDMDTTFGVVPIDPDRGLYAVQVKADKLPQASNAEPYRGPWSSPRIVPFGPVQTGKER